MQLHSLFRTTSNIAPLVARLALGFVMLPHGLQKTVGCFQGPGFTGAMHHLHEHYGVPPLLAVLAIAAESAGSVALILGLGTRVAAFGIGVTMLVAGLLVHWKAGFFMNWFGTQSGEGYEYHLLAIGLSVVLTMTGGGAVSMDRWLVRWFTRTAFPASAESPR